MHVGHCLRISATENRADHIESIADHGDRGRGRETTTKYRYESVVAINCDQSGYERTILSLI